MYKVIKSPWTTGFILGTLIYLFFPYEYIVNAFKDTFNKFAENSIEHKILLFEKRLSQLENK